MKKKIIYVLCILGVLLVLLGLKKRNDTMYSSGVYHLNRSGIVESIENNNIVVRLDKLNEQDEDFKNVNTLQLDCRNCSYELENLKEYKEWLKELKERLLKAQIKASVVVNKELHNFYWELGADIVEKQEKALWGSSFLNKLSKDLSEEFPNMKGFSSRNLNYIKKWYQFWNRAEILQRPVAEIKDAIFSIPWGQNIEIITKVKSHEEAFFYAQGTLEYNWSRPVLVHQIESKLYERKGKAINNFQNLLPATHSDLARDITKDPYNFDFLTLTANYNEREHETGLVNHITKFLNGVGRFRINKNSRCYLLNWKIFL